ncbi:MAG: DUF4386 family protein [Thermoleophilia bacterium]|nr:DUF4386 family protein [Thermoleophilia bacterium]
MSQRSDSVIGGLSGIGALVLSIGGFAVIGAAGFALPPGASKADVADAARDGNPGLALAGLFLDTLGSLLLIVFAAHLWTRLRRAEGEIGWLATASLASAVLMVAAGLGDKAAYYAIFSRAESGLDAVVGTALYDTATGFFVLFQALAGLFLVVTGAAALRTGALRRWLGWTGVVLGAVGIASTAAPESGAGQLALPLVFAWILAVAVTLLRPHALEPA